MTDSNSIVTSNGAHTTQDLIVAGHAATSSTVPVFAGLPTANTLDPLLGGNARAPLAALSADPKSLDFWNNSQGQAHITQLLKSAGNHSTAVMRTSTLSSVQGEAHTNSLLRASALDLGTYDLSEPAYNPGVYNNMPNVGSGPGIYSGPPPGTLPPGEAADLAVKIWYNEGKIAIHNILGRDLSDKVMKDFRDVIHGRVKEQKAGYAQAVTEQLYKIASSQEAFNARNAIFNDVRMSGIDVNTDKYYAEQMAIGNSSLDKMRHDIVYDSGNVTRVKLSDAIMAIEGRPANAADEGWIQDRLGDLYAHGSLAQIYTSTATWVGEHGGYDNIIRAALGHPVTAGDRPTILLAEKNIGEGSATYASTLAGVATWAGQNHVYEDMVSGIQNRNTDSGDQPYLQNVVNNIVQGKTTYQSERDGLIDFSGEANVIGDAFKNIHGRPASQADIDWARGQLHSGLKIQDYIRNEAHNAESTQTITSYYNTYAGISAPTDGQISYYEDKLGQQEALTSVRNDVIDSSTEVQAAINKAYDQVHGRPAGQNDFDHARGDMHVGVSLAQYTWNEAHGAEATQTIAGYYQIYAGISAPTDGQISFYADKLGRQEALTSVKNDVINGGEVQTAIDKVYDQVHGRPAGQNDLDYARGQMRSGVTLAQYTWNEAHGAEAARTITDYYNVYADISAPTSGQIGFYEDKLGAGETLYQMRSMIQHSVEAKNALNLIQQQVQGIAPGSESQSWSNWAMDEMEITGRSISDMRVNIASSEQTRDILISFISRDVGVDLSSDPQNLIRKLQDDLGSGKITYQRVDYLLGMGSNVSSIIQDDNVGNYTPIDYAPPDSYTYTDGAGNKFLMTNTVSFQQAIDDGKKYYGDWENNISKLYEGAKIVFAHGGTFDFQRNNIDHTLNHQYVQGTNYVVGIWCAAAGLPMSIMDYANEIYAYRYDADPKSVINRDEPIWEQAWRDYHSGFVK